MSERRNGPSHWRVLGSNVHSSSQRNPLSAAQSAGAQLKTASLVLRAVSSLNEAGFRGYDTPDKLCKMKKHLGYDEALSFLPGDEFVVSDKLRGCLRIFDLNGQYKKSLASNSRPLGVAANRSASVAYVNNKPGKEKVIRVVAAENGSVFSSWGEEDWKPRAICWNNKGQLVISDTLGPQVGVYTVDGKCMTMFDSRGGLQSPWNIAVDPYDRVAVSDRARHVVNMYDDHGRFLYAVGKYGSADGELINPRGVCSDSKGNLFVCDTGNKRVSLFSPDGRFIQHFLQAQDGLARPFAIALDRGTGRILVSQHDSDTLRSFRKIRLYRINQQRAETTHI